MFNTAADHQKILHVDIFISKQIFRYLENTCIVIHFNICIVLNLHTCVLIISLNIKSHVFFLLKSCPQKIMTIWLCRFVIWRSKVLIIICYIHIGGVFLLYFLFIFFLGGGVVANYPCMKKTILLLWNWIILHLIFYN